MCGDVAYIASRIMDKHLYAKHPEKINVNLMKGTVIADLPYCLVMEVKRGS